MLGCVAAMSPPLATSLAVVFALTPVDCDTAIRADCLKRDSFYGSNWLKDGGRVDAPGRMSVAPFGFPCNRRKIGLFLANPQHSAFLSRAMRLTSRCWSFWAIFVAASANVPVLVLVRSSGLGSGVVIRVA